MLLHLPPLLPIRPKAQLDGKAPVSSAFVATPNLDAAEWIRSYRRPRCKECTPGDGPRDPRGAATRRSIPLVPSFFGASDDWPLVPLPLLLARPGISASNPKNLQ